jgi:hypothetical protein
LAKKAALMRAKMDFISVVSEMRRAPHLDSTSNSRLAQPPAPGPRSFPSGCKRIRLAGVTESIRTFELLGTPLLATTYDELTAHAHALARRGGTYAIDLTNTHIVTLRRQDPYFREITSRFDHFVPTGCPSSGA